MYDCLEEFTTCGYTFFPVRDISKQLKQKSHKQSKEQAAAAGGVRANEYEKEYMVRCRGSEIKIKRVSWRFD